jgi:hypothetical protein
LLRVREALDNVELAVEDLGRLLGSAVKTGLDMALAGTRERSELVELDAAAWLQALGRAEERIRRARELLEAVRAPGV